MVNKVILVGRVGSDVELKTSKAGKPFCHIKLATNTGFGDNKRTDWHKVAVFGKTAEACAKFVSKGSIIYVEGSIQYDEYEKDGKKQYATNILADGVQFIQSNGAAKQQSQQPVPPAPVETDFPTSPIDNFEIPF